ncbi:MAG: thiamine-phosphate kinase [Candidatus Scalindua rubra]|uniref:Thiamine-monophosphate kinase n=1 Tax=Candidatus Scalindua brodae TaxID=237368 RepID=A0A0B0EM67_9BACT|nr:MAG: thiamine-monophosphate kinase [Candidatus Scalindua brodae]MBZ0108240.1 thiamine-phosphate kinase [Candidatus Scalindua rubra]TWU33504.1 Thiamine-monophosphate kinase [Candidatus Brocadiaceae bacterium S225]
MDEFSFIKWIRSNQKKDKNIIIGIGDDCASIRINDDNVFLVTTDMLVEGTHFNLKKSTPGEIGRKSIACSISDIAAMGCSAKYAVISICFPHETKTKFARDLYRGIQKMADAFNIRIIGGDIVSSKKTLVINVTMYGRNEGLKSIPRSGAKANDVIMITGALGGSILGKHITFKPRLKEGLLLNKKFNINSMIDISDGLVADLGHILEESGVGAVLYEEEVPVSADARKLARKTGLSALYHALHDGEDYELLFTLSDKESKKLLAFRSFPARLSKIGHINKSKGIKMQGADGKLKRIKSIGYTHFK